MGMIRDGWEEGHADDELGVPVHTLVPVMDLPNHHDSAHRVRVRCQQAAYCESSCPTASYLATPFPTRPHNNPWPAPPSRDGTTNALAGRS